MTLNFKARHTGSLNDSAQPVEPQDALSRRLTRALEAAPPVRIPQDFAARIAAQARVQAPAAIRPSTRFGEIASYTALALLLTAMLLFAPWARTGRIVPVANELLLALEFVALMTWTSLRPGIAR